MAEYTILDAHADGRHASVHPEDRSHWVRAGCVVCAEFFDSDGLPRPSAVKMARADVAELLESIRAGVDTVPWMRLARVAAVLDEAERLLEGDQ